MRRIPMPIETWMLVLSWLQRRATANRLADGQLCWDRQFSAIVLEWLHEYIRNVHLPKLWFVKKEQDDQEGQEGCSTGISGQGLEHQCQLHRLTGQDCEDLHHPRWRSELVPIAQGEMPGNITDFWSIDISYLDSTVLTFLHSVQRLFVVGVHLDFFGFNQETTRPALQLLLPLLLGPIESISINYSALLFLFRDHFWSQILEAKLLNTFIASYDSEWPECWELLSRWLHTPRADGQPRTLLISTPLGTSDILECIDKIQETFLDADSQVSFFLRFFRTGEAEEDEFMEEEEDEEAIEDEELADTRTENPATGEQLTVKIVADEYNPDSYLRRVVLISRCSLDESPEWLAQKQHELSELRFSGQVAEVPRSIGLHYLELGQLSGVDV